MTHILVTGATGFVGRHLCHSLSARNQDVVAAVRRVPDPVHPPLTGVSWLPVGEIGPETSRDAAACEGLDTIIHLAARTHVPEAHAPNPDVEFDREMAIG